MDKHKAFLKWAGGKYDLIERIFALAPDKYDTFIDAFGGSGVVSLNVPLGVAIGYGDTNEALVATWKALQRDPKEFVKASKHFFNGQYNNSREYYAIRDGFNSDLKDTFPSIQARNWQLGMYFLYLNRHCFNGLCRFNSKGEFNTPFGQYKKPYFPEAELLYAGEVSQKMAILHGGFEDIMKHAGKKTVVYCDPPYLPVSDTSDFTAYSAGGFSIDDQKRLVQSIENARDNGATVIVSNNNVPLAHELYKNASKIETLDVAKRISCKGTGRKKQSEVLAVYRP